MCRVKTLCHRNRISQQQNLTDRGERTLSLCGHRTTISNVHYQKKPKHADFHLNRNNKLSCVHLEDNQLTTLVKRRQLGYSRIQQHLENHMYFPARVNGSYKRRKKQKLKTAKVNLWALYNKKASQHLSLYQLQTWSKSKKTKVAKKMPLNKPVEFRLKSNPKRLKFSWNQLSKDSHLLRRSRLSSSWILDN